LTYLSQIRGVLSQNPMSAYIKNYVPFLILLFAFVGESDGKDVYWSGTGVG
jgi:hypothetical protein